MKQCTTTLLCPVCGEPTQNEKAKLICRSKRCGFRIVMTCCD